MNSDTIGFLTVKVTTANGAIPIENAAVHISGYDPKDEGTDTGDAIYSLRTDLSGRTDTVALNTKDAVLSNTPGNITPFSTYNITVTADGYYESEKINVPIFQGITSIQNVELIPLSEFADPYSATPNEAGRFTVTPDNEL